MAAYQKLLEVSGRLLIFHFLNSGVPETMQKMQKITQDSIDLHIYIYFDVRFVS